MKKICIALGLVLSSAPPAVRAQSNSDSLSLAALQNSAVERDARSLQLALLESQTNLRLKNIGAELRPAVSVNSFAQYQSDVARIPFTSPAGANPLALPHDTYDAWLNAQQLIYDPSRTARRNVERAQLRESQSRVHTSLYSLRQNVNDAFFAALAAQERIAEVETSVTDLEAQLAVASARVREGTALPSEALSIRAELLRRAQTVAEWKANRQASLSVLGNLVGRTLDSRAQLAVPELDSARALPVEFSRAQTGRPEFELFRASREVVERKRDARAAQNRPRIAAYGRAGYGQPGLNPLGTRFDSYWLAGIQMQWTPLNGGTTGRDREILKLQGEIGAADEAAFAAALERQTIQDGAQFNRLQSALSADVEIITLRERIAAEYRARYREGVITSAEYVDRQTDVMSARIARAQHRVERAALRARLNTTLGIEGK